MSKGYMPDRKKKKLKVVDKSESYSATRDYDKNQTKNGKRKVD